MKKVFALAHEEGYRLSLLARLRILLAATAPRTNRPWLDADLRGDEGGLWGMI